MKTAPRYKVCRKLGEGVYAKCQTTAYSLAESKKKPQTTFRRRGRGGGTEYATQLKEKQRVRLSYGITEGQLSKYVQQARKAAKGTPVQTLFQTLESRLDSITYRLGLARSRQQARQLVSHGHLQVNGRRVNVPSVHVKVGDVITVRDGSKQSALFALENEDGEDLGRNAPGWLSFDKKKFEAKKKQEPKQGEYDTHLDFASLMEYYSRI